MPLVLADICEDQRWTLAASRTLGDPPREASLEPVARVGGDNDVVVAVVIRGPVDCLVATGADDHGLLAALEVVRRKRVDDVPASFVAEVDLQRADEATLRSRRDDRDRAAVLACRDDMAGEA